uniref:Chromosome X open reading frame 65 n=1 Tax=Terrapene triunguis TaxID=2587831 RepID=A0A674KJD8_9SAUR
MFICVKHGENQQFLANTCCSVLLLLHYLRSKVGLRRTEAIDLCDEQGTLKLLFLVKLPSDSASKFLSPRGTYYVCRVERGAPGTKQENAYRAFTPVLKDPEQELLDALRTQCEFLEKSRLELLKAQDGKKIQTMESLISIVPSQISVSSMPPACSPGSGAADEEGAPRKAGPSPKIKPEASKKEKHR